jgi:hypothetical protein
MHYENRDGHTLFFHVLVTFFRGESDMRGGFGHLGDP